ncbi:flagellar export protein FliJ [Brevibacillus laterosporus]|uniref:flagellar export protein FliJ n=1 Tax=Brevibacillus laterosporus TaxID=1465 RepID=UPI0018F86EBD|nr:flagellar export protein FliJ [Brevibacillus laterosporus]
MKPFRFHMQKVLDLKEKETEQAQWAFGRSVQQKQQEEQKLYQLVDKRNDMSDSLVDMQHDACSASDLLAVTRFQQVVDRQIATQKRRIIGCDKEIERCKEKLHFHLQESKLWSTLRDKAQTKYIEWQNQVEQKEMDEIGTNRFRRQLKQG